MNEKEKILKKLQQLCSRKEYCKKDIYDKLSKTSLTTDEKEHIIQLLINEGFINEKRYVEAFIHDKIFLQKWGKLKVLYSLKQKNINETLINKAIDNIPHDNYENLFLNLAKLKLKSFGKLDTYQQKVKLHQYLAQKGVEYELIDKIVAKLIND